MIGQAERALAEARNYKVVPLREDQADDARMLSLLLREEPESIRDPKRDGFYWIDGRRSRYYINVHDDAETVYLVTVAHA